MVREERNKRSHVIVTTRGLHATIAATLSCLVVLVSLEKASAMEMDRSVPILAATIQHYVNYLYLTDLFGKPTALLPQGKFCPDVLGLEKTKTLTEDIDNIIREDFWKLRCEPVSPTKIQKNKDGTFDVQLRYIKLFESRVWIEKLKANVLSTEIDAQPLLSTDRQLQLSRLYFPEKERTFNYFWLYGRTNYVKNNLIMQMKMISKRRIVERDGDLVGEIEFSLR